VAESDRARWDRKYAGGSHSAGSEPDWLDALDVELPRSGAALDVASGTGRVARWLVRRGLDVTAVDVSPVGLELARSQAQQSGLEIRTRALDLTTDRVPAGPWKLISCFAYLQRDLFPALIQALAPDGFLVVEIATVRNLERNARPSRRFLLERGEINDLVGPLKVDYYREDWFGEQALARLVAHPR